MVDLKALQYAGAEVVENDIGLGHEGVEGLAAFLGAEIERDAPLVAIETEEVGALTIEEIRAQLARGVPRARLLDLDDVGAEVGQEPACERPPKDGGELEDADVLQGHAHRPASKRKSPDG